MNLASNTTADLELDVKIEDPADKRRGRRQQAPQTVDGGGGGGGDPTGGEGDENIEEMEEEIVLKYGAAHVIKLFIPVTLCLVFVIISLTMIKSYQQSDGATL